MKRIVLSIIMFLFLLSCSCVSSSKLADNVVYDNILPWQLEAIGGLFPAYKEYYYSQQGMLETDIAQEYFLQCDMIVTHRQQSEELLDTLHEYLQNWMLMRSNMLEIHTCENNDHIYSLVYTAGYDSARGLYLIQYSIEDNGTILIENCIRGEMPISSGFLPNIADFGDTVLFGLVQSERWVPETDTKELFDPVFIEVEYSNGLMLYYDIQASGSVLIVLPKLEEDLLMVQALRNDYEVIESYKL